MKTKEILVSKHLAERIYDLENRIFTDNAAGTTLEKGNTGFAVSGECPKPNNDNQVIWFNEALINLLKGREGGLGFTIINQPVHNFNGFYVVIPLVDMNAGGYTADLTSLNLLLGNTFNIADLQPSHYISMARYYVRNKNSCFYIAHPDKNCVCLSDLSSEFNHVLSFDNCFILLSNCVVKKFWPVRFDKIEIKNNSIILCGVDPSSEFSLPANILVKIEFSSDFISKNNLLEKLEKSVAAQHSASREKIHVKDDAGTAKSSSCFPSKLFSCMDYLRARLPKISRNRLESVSEGSMELFTGPKVPDGYVRMNLDRECVSLDPWELVQDGATVAIDFGTTSTVAAFLNTRGVVELLRMKSFEEEISESHYENPSVLEFKNFKRFYDTWLNEDYRPLTEWEDLYGSYDAKEQLRDHASCGISNIKAWAFRRHNSFPLRLEDEENGYPVELEPLPVENDEEKSLGNWQERPLDPIEVYGYYLGLCLNNQSLRDGAIYLNYRLTFPVKYDLETRNRIKQGLRRGLLRSLPPALVYSDKWNKARFSVEFGISEPEALVSSVVPAIGLDSNLEKPLPFAVFDFGGGTTDFAAGFYRKPTAEEEDEYDAEVIIETVDVSGIDNLGGEHIVDSLYYAVLSGNAALLMSKGICFVCPSDMNMFPGSETLWGRGSDAYGNMAVLREKLRPVWENSMDDIEDVKTEGKLAVQFKNTNGEYVNIDLLVDIDHLVSIIRERITAGVESFFSFFCQAFTKYDRKGLVDRIHIIFSGNSCRTPVIREVFAEEKQKWLNVKSYDNEKTEEILNLISEHYELIDEWKKDSGAKQDNDDVSAKTAVTVNSMNGIKVTLKNCVALGLLKILSSGIYPLRAYVSDSDNPAETEAPFSYCVGKFKEGFLVPLFMRGTPYGEWMKFDRLRKPRIGNAPFLQIGWSNDPFAAKEKQIQQNGCPVKTLYFDSANIGKNLYMRAVEPHVIEIACFAMEDTSCENPLEVNSVNLS